MLSMLVSPLASAEEPQFRTSLDHLSLLPIAGGRLDCTLEVGLVEAKSPECRVVVVEPARDTDVLAFAYESVSPVALRTRHHALVKARLENSAAMSR